jgi:sucrose-phosphate synthase
LGGKKMDNLGLTEANFDKVNDNYKFHIRIFAERVSFRNARAIIASTKEEIKQQYGHVVYEGVIKNKNKFNIIPPGINTNQFFSYHMTEQNNNLYKKAVEKLKKELKKNIFENRLYYPCIFSAARFEAKKNPVGLLRAYAESKYLQKKANLLIVAGKVEDPLKIKNRSKFNENEKLIIEDIVTVIDKYGLSGKVCFLPGFNYITELPYIYRYAGRNKWVFINPAFHEPFGLTIVEAMASGLPVVATKHGGPAEILGNNKYGILIEPTDLSSINEGLKKMFNINAWKTYSLSGIERVKEKYTWERAAFNRLKLIKRIRKDSVLSFRDDYKIPDYFINPTKENYKKILEKFKKISKKNSGPVLKS